MSSATLIAQDFGLSRQIALAQRKVQMLDALVRSPLASVAERERATAEIEEAVNRSIPALQTELMRVRIQLTPILEAQRLGG